MKRNEVIFILVMLFLFYQKAGGIDLRLDRSDMIDSLRISEIETADIDNDGIIDSLYYDSQKQSMIVLLSGLKYTPMLIKWGPDFGWQYCDLDAFDGGIGISYNDMRVSGDIEYAYEKGSNRFRLSGMGEEYHGPDGYYKTSHDFLTNTFVSDYWTYPDMELDSLVSIPTFEANVFYPPIYMDDSLWIVDDSQESKIIEYHKNRSMADTRMGAISKNMLLKSKIPSIPSSELSTLPIDSLIMGYGMGMGYDKATLQFIISDTIFTKSYDYTAHIVVLSPYKQYKLFLLSFDFDYGPSGILVYMLDKTGKCSDTLSFWFYKEKGESIYLKINDPYEIIIEKKRDQEAVESLKYFIDTVKCKFTKGINN